MACHGDLHAGFARLVCQSCGRNFLLAYSCKRRTFCPSCHQKRVVEFGEWLSGNVLKRHSGFNVFAGGRIQPREKKSLENLAAYLIR